MRHTSHAIPKEFLEKWQVTVNVLANIFDVPSGLIMRILPSQVEVLVASETSNNPYQPGEKAELNTGLYCETVMASRSLLYVPNALEVPHWKNNPDVARHMISYLGIPLLWAENDLFGTICVLDSKERIYQKKYINLLWEIKKAIESDFTIIKQQKRLLASNEGLARRVQERTAELSRINQELEAEVAAHEKSEKSLRKSEQRYRHLNETLELRVKGAVEELRTKDGLLLVQDRQAVLGEMISNIAHQWRQPLNMLGLLAQELPVFYQRGQLSAEYLNDNVKKTLEIIRNMSRTIDYFGNFFQPDTEKVHFRALELIEKVITLLEGGSASHGIRTEIIATGDPPINGYPNQFAQVILNLISNAREALLARTSVDPTITITVAGESGRATVTIGDNAGGIPAGVIDKIFDPYFTTKGPDKGTGMGLYMCKTIIEKNMGGTLQARNFGAGAEFRIEI